MKLGFFENRRIAWTALAVVAVLSIVGLGGGKLARERTAVLDVFTNGTDTSLSVRHSMDAYLDRAADAAISLAKEGFTHLGSEDSNSFVVNRLAQEVQSEENLSARSDRYAELRNAVETLYAALATAKLTDAQMVDATAAYSDFASAQNLIKNDQFAQLADAYNDRAGGFPASLLKGLYRLDEVDNFGN